ncbi:MAG: hypothetical protein RL745_333 [Actinomycetota bacterium]|jgi:CubicO group peptidase (beta-lactamase class C family)
MSHEGLSSGRNAQSERVWRRRTLKVARRTGYTVIALFVALWAFTISVRYPNPVMSYRLGFAAASKTVELQASRPIKATTAAMTFGKVNEPMPADVVWRDQPMTFERFLKTTSTNAFVVVRNGNIAYEYYADGVQPSQKLPSYSVAKSVVGMLAWQQIEAGTLKLDTKFVDLFPELKASDQFNKITLRHLLEMSGGLAANDDYPSGPSGWGRPIAQMFATTDMMYFLGKHRDMRGDPGTIHEYHSIDAQLAGMMVSKAAGKPLSELVQTKIFAPMGAEFDASWTLDRNGGWEKSFCCLNMAARDYARLGQVLVNNGTGAHGKVLGEKAMNAVLKPTLPEFSDDKWGYGAFVWHPHPDALAFTGLHEQLVVVLPATQTVVVKLSDAVEGHNAESVEVMYQIAKTAAL